MKSFRTANIRVHLENKTEQGNVYYTYKQLKDTLKDFSETYNSKYWCILHDEGNLHFHATIKFNKPVPFERIKSKFPYGDIEPARNIKASVQYLIHQNNPSKKQYSREEIVTNSEDELPLLLQRSKNQEEISVEAYFEKIRTGEIKQYNITKDIPIKLYAKYKNQLSNCFKYYEENEYMNKDREITTIFIYGEAGVGKSLWAKQLAQKLDRKICISSHSNDPLQDYKHEEILFLDDMTDDYFKYEDMLKLLDPNTKSTSKSRFNNKHFVGDYIIFASNKPWESWYDQVKGIDRKALYRRIHLYYQMDRNFIREFKWNKETNGFIETAKTENKVHAIEAFQKERESMLKVMGWQ